MFYAFIQVGNKKKVVRPSRPEWTLVLGKARSYFSLDEMLSLPFPKDVLKRLKKMKLGDEIDLVAYTTTTRLAIYCLTAQQEAILEESVKVSNATDVVEHDIKKSIPPDLSASLRDLTQQMKQLKKMAKSSGVILKI